MLKKLFYFLMLISCLYSCDLNQQQSNNLKELEVSTVNDIKIQILKKKYDELKKTHNVDYKIKDSLIFSEGVSWKSIAFYKKNQLEILAETNWVDSSIISRVTIFDSAIISSVGSSIQEIESLIDTNILNNSSDGHLTFVNKNDSEVRYVMDISSYPNLFYGVGFFNEIPKEIRVECIVIVADNKN